MYPKNIHGRSRITKTILRVVEFVLADMKTSHKAAVVKTVCGWQERDTGKWDRVANPETYPEALYSHMQMETCQRWHCKSI